MTVLDIFAGVAVADFEAALPWWERLFGRPPDATPMDGLAEWHVPDGARLQLVADAERAGKSTVTLVVDDLAEYLDELRGRGLATGRLDDTTSDVVRFTFIADPEGNRIALVEWRSARFA